MTNFPVFRPLTVVVKFDGENLECVPSALEIPTDTIATITWVPHKKGLRFIFLQFAWEHSNGFLTQEPIIHDQCIVGVVNNTAEDSCGDWPYVLKVQVGDHVYQTGTPAATDGKPVIHNQ